MKLLKIRKKKNDDIKNTNVDEDNETFLDETNEAALKYLCLDLENQQINHKSIIELINIKKQNEILKNSQEIELLEEELDKIQKELRGEDRNG